MKTDYDMVIIGAGIHGAGVAQAAAAQGYSVLLLEQYAEPAQGTSSRSSKLIHGGLRYLEQGELKLVYECLRERKRLLQNAPDLVNLRPFYIPVYKSSKHKPWKIRAGLTLYSLLAGLGKETRFRSIPKSEWSNLRGLKQTDLLAVFCYQDAQTDDAALTRAVIRSAKSMGAETHYGALFTEAVKVDAGYRVCYTINNHRNDITSRTLVHASGPWIDGSMRKVSPTPALPAIDLVQGTHILLPGNIGDDIFYLQAPGGRAVFVMPWRSGIMVGTTEYVFNGDPVDCEPTDNEIDYLLAVFNYHFPNFYPHGKAVRNDINGSFAGLRVLPGSTDNPFGRSRETILIKDSHRKPALIGIYGGKLTSYRATAEKVLRQLRGRLGKPKQVRDTGAIALTPHMSD